MEQLIPSYRPRQLDSKALDRSFVSADFFSANAEIPAIAHQAYFSDMLKRFS